MRRILVTTTLAVIAATLPAGAALAAEAPPNDDFANAQPIQGYRGSTPGNNRGATGEPGEPENARGTTPINSIWYRWTAPASGPVVIDTCGSDPYFDTTLGVYIVGHFPQVISTVATNDNDSGCEGFQSKVRFSAVAGVTYHISVDGWSHYTGSVVLRWALGPPENDDFADAEVIEGTHGYVRGTNENATGEPGEPDNAGVSEPIESVWYRWTAPYSGTATFGTCSSRFDTTLGVYTGTRVDGLTEVASNDDACWIKSRVEFSADVGATYHISVDGWESHEGRPVLSWYLEENDAPTSSATSPAYTTGRTFAVDYAASDAGSGIAQVELWVRGPNDAGFSFAAIEYEAEDTGSFVFTASEGDGTYEFYTRARDRDGNREPAPSAADTSTFVDSARRCTIIGTAGNDALAGTAGPDTICGLAGDDTASASNGDDLLLGGAGNDTATGDHGNDTMEGDRGDDTLRGGNGADALNGGTGSDQLFGESANDSLDARDNVSGNDSSDGGSGTDACASDAGDAVSGCP